jgi:hypothetical protein
LGFMEPRLKGLMQPVVRPPAHGPSNSTGFWRFGGNAYAEFIIVA